MGLVSPSQLLQSQRRLLADDRVKRDLDDDEDAEDPDADDDREAR